MLWVFSDIIISWKGIIQALVRGGHSRLSIGYVTLLFIYLFHELLCHRIFIVRSYEYCDDEKNLIHKNEVHFQTCYIKDAAV